MDQFISILFMSVSLATSTYLVFSLWEFVRFVVDWGLDAETSNDDPLNAVLTDMGLVLLFIVQHKLMHILKQVIVGTKIEPVYRSLYVFGTGLALQAIVTYWSPTSYKVWDLTRFLMGAGPLQTPSLLAAILYWFYRAVPVFFLVLVFMQVLMADLPLLVGLKQTYYHLSGQPNPMMLKSPELYRYIGHTPHPILGVLAVLWLRHMMSLDRFILACGFTVYATQFKTDDLDVKYVKEQIGAAKLK